jgi:hypothetical protein
MFSLLDANTPLSHRKEYRIEMSNSFVGWFARHCSLLRTQREAYLHLKVWLELPVVLHRQAELCRCRCNSELYLLWQAVLGVESRPTVSTMHPFVGSFTLAHQPAIIHPFSFHLSSIAHKLLLPIFQTYRLQNRPFHLMCCLLCTATSEATRRAAIHHPLLSQWVLDTRKQAVA